MTGNPLNGAVVGRKSSPFYIFNPVSSIQIVQPPSTVVPFGVPFSVQPSVKLLKADGLPFTELSDRCETNASEIRNNWEVCPSTPANGRIVRVFLESVGSPSSRYWLSM